MLAVNFVNVGNLVDIQLLGMQSRLTSGLNNYKTGTQSTIPLVGSSLGTASQIVSRFDTDVKNALASLGSITVTDDSISQIQNALAGVPERVGDVVVTRTGSLGSEGFTVEMRLGGTFVPSSANIGFNTGIPGLPLKVATTGTIDVSVGYAFELAFTFNSNTSTVALDSSKTLSGLTAPDGSHPIVDALNPLAIFITAGLHEGFSARATLGFVDGTAAAIDGQPNGLYLTAMVNNLSGTPTFKLDGGADANLRVTGSFAGTNDDFPAIDVDFHLHWSFSSSDPTVAPQVTYDNVNLNFGQFISNVVRPVFQIIQTTTKPMEPVQEILRYPLPGLSDLSHLIGQGDITLLSLATLVAPYTNYGPLWDLIHSLGDLIYSIDQLNIDSSVKMPLGGFDLNDYDLRTVAPAGDIQDLSVANLTTLVVNHLHAANAPIPSQVNDFSHALSAAETNGYRIDFPILDDPKQAIFNLLLGRESDLFTFTVDEDVTAQGGQVPSLEVFGMGVEFGGEIPVQAHFKFGYDTLGLRELLNDVASGNTSNVASDVKDGFYISDDSYFKLSGSLVAGVGVSIGIYSAKVGGFVSTDNGGDDPVSITFEDPNHDGKVRFSEFDTALHTSGRLTGDLGIEVGIGVEVLGHFIGVKHRFDIASVVLVDLNKPGPNDPPIIAGPILASQPDAQGSIDLYIGAEAVKRQEVDQMDGNERIIIQHVEPPPGSPPPDPNSGETIEISIFQGTFLGTDFWVSQTISGVKSISGYGDLGDLNINVLPEVTSAVHFEGGDGKATLTYSGSGAAYLKAGGEDSELNGGSGSNTLLGGPGNDTLVLGSAVNVVGGGAGNNTVVITTPMTQGGLIVGGTDEGNNTFVVLAGEGTQSISATPGLDPGSIDLNYQLAGLPPSPALALALLQFSTFVISAQDRATNITIGDLSGAGVTQVYVNEPTAAATGRTVDLDARAGSGASNLSLLPFAQIYGPDPNNPLNFVIDNALQFVNSSTGMTTYLFGMAGADQTTIHQHGGTTSVGQLLKDDGNVTFDTSTRQPGQSEIVTFSTPALDAGNIITTHGNAAGDFIVDAINYPTLTFHGLATQDISTMNVAAPTLLSGANQVTLDATTLVGALNVNALGDATSTNQITLVKAGTRAAVAIDGGTSTTNVQFGASRLSDIQHSSTVRNAILTIDDSATLTPDISTLSASSYQWTIPALGFSPTLSVSGLHGALTVKTGSGDKYDVEQTPPGITQLVFINSQAAIQNAVYASGASSPIVLNGNFSLYLGWRLNLDGSVAQLNHLGGLPVTVTENFSGTPTGDVVFDGDFDPAGASYLIDGVGDLHVLNQTVGLDVTINGFRDQDQLHLHLPGGSVHANLMQTGPGIITVDGSARATGTNPSANNNITVDARGGNITLDPAGNDVSVLHLSDTLYVAGSLPQDNLTVNVPTQTNVTNTVTIDASQLQGTLHVNVVDPLAQILSPFGFSTVILAAVNPLLAVFIIGTDPFPGTANYQVAQTTVDFGTGQLARIQGNVAISKAVLNINDSSATQPSNLELSATTFSNWVIPATSLTPALTYLGLYNVLTVYAGAGDQLELDHTPGSISAIALNNATSTQDAVYSSDWSVPITANGNWSIYLGRYLHTDGSIERIKSLAGLPVAVTLNFSGVPISQVVLDGDADPAGAQYVIDGNGNLHFKNQMVGLDVTINGYRDQDEATIYLPGGSVSADLRNTGPGILTVNGDARLAGVYPTASNSISAQVRAGNISLDPVNTNDSVMHAFNTVYVLGSMPQDSLNVTAPTSFEVAPSQQGSPRTSVGVYTGYFGAYNVVNQPTDFYTVLSWPFQPMVITDSSDPAVLVGNPPPSGVNYFDTTLLYRYSGPDPQGLPDVLVPVRMYPLTSAPTAIDNTANFDASQLRGSFNFQVAQPDYSAAETLVAGFGYRSALPAEAFGQTTVVLSKVNPQLSVSITGTTPVASADYNNLNSFDALGVVHYPATQVTVGTGTLTDVQGNVAVHNVWLKEVNDRLGTTTNVITMTGSTLTGWLTAAGTTHPSLSFDTLQGDLAVSGSPVDRFDIEGMPNSAPRVTIQNFATSGPAAGVYVMGKSVMPLFVTGNFALNVGRRLNADGTVTNVGQVGGVYDYHNRFNPDGVGLTDFFTQQHLFENLQFFNPNGAALVPGVTYDTYVADYIFSGQQPLPVFFNYTGSGQSTLVFDASGDVLNHGHWGNISFNPSTNYIGIAANANYPGQADLRFFQGDVLYGSNIETFFYGPQLIGAQSSQNKAGPSVLIDNPSTSPVHYIGGAHTANDAEEILIGAARGPVTVAGAGLGTLVELNPLFSLPLANPTLVGTAEQVFSLHGLPGWTSGNTAGFSLLDTIHADVTITGASLRVIGDIPLPAGVQPPQTVPDVHVSGNQITGIAGATIHFSNLLDVTSSSNFAGWGVNLDIEFAELPGLSILLPGHAFAATFVDDTPAGITTAIGSVLSSSDATLTAGPMSVLKTTGPLVLGQLFGSLNYPWPVAAGQPVGSLSWADGLSIPSITIGSGGSVQNIHGPILLLGDPHNNSPLVTNIDGSADASRSAVNFVAQSYLQAPDGIIASKVAAVSGFSFFEEVRGFAPATIYFGPYFNRVRNLNVYGSAGSSYNVTAAPPTMRLFAGANSSVVNSSAPISIFGATTVQLILSSYSDIPGYSGTPQVVVEQDPTHPQPIALRVDQTPFGVFPTTPAGTLHLDNAGGSLLALALNTGQAFGNPNYWGVLYDGSNTHLAVNYGPIVISDTGTAGTTISAGVQSIDVYGTTGPLTINPSGSAFSGGNVRLGQSGNMQAIHGDVTILSNTAPLPAANVTLNNSADTTRRTIDLATDVDGNTLITGSAPGAVKLVGSQFGPTLNGGVGGSTFDVETKTSPFFDITGGSTADLLIGPDSSNVWQIFNGNTIYLNSNLLVQNVPNIRGEAGADTFNLSGQLPGDLDGGAGINTLSYPSYAAWHGVPFDLLHGVAPLVGGLASHLQIVPIEMTGVSNQQRQAGVPIAPIQFPILGGLGNFAYLATGLPSGLAIATNTGAITGTLSESAVSATPYAIHVSANDGFNTATADFQLTVLPGVAVVNPGSQSQSPGTPVSLTIQATSVYGQPLTYSATGLPAGLSIAPNTGVITGAISESAESGSPYLVNVTATDGTHSGSTSFQWTVMPSFSLVNPGTLLAPEGVPVNLLIHANNPANRSLSFYVSASFGIPGYLSFTSIDNSTAAFQGTVYAYGGTYFWPVTVYATDGTSTVSTSFNIETVPGFDVYPAYDQTNRAGDTVYVYAGVYNNAHGHNLTYDVSGLPPGLAFNPGAASITGTIDVNADTNVPYHTLITVTDHTLNYVYPITFQWTVTPLIILGQLSDQSTTVGNTVNLPVTLIRDFGRPVTFSADNLPLGISIDPTTGQIHGTVGPQTASPADLPVVVHADDGQATGDISFTWHVASAASNVVQLADTIHGGVVTLASPTGTSLSAAFTDLYYPNAIETPLGYLMLSVAGVAPGAAANVVITPPVGHNWTDYYVYGPTPDGAYGWYDFLYQPAANDASTTGAEFLPNGQIVLHLVDGGRGDSDLSPDGVISMATGGGPAFTQLQVHISAAPQSWPLGVPITLGSEINGTAAPGATIDWQVWVYTNDFQYLQVAEVNTASITFTPQLAGTYYVTLAVTSQSEQFTANDYLNFPAASPTGSAPLARFGTAGLSASVISGQTFGGQVLALDADGNIIANYTGAVSAVIADDHGHPVANLSGNFNGGVFAFSAPSITTPSGIPVTYTLSLTSGSVSTQLPLIVHPISHIGAIESTPITATAGQSFGFAVQTEDDRGEFAPNFTGSVRLTYTDASGTHDIGGGYQSVANGVVTFIGVVLPAAGTYQLHAMSADGVLSGSFVMTVAPGQELPGDYNHDGFVDAIDYVVWRKNHGTQTEYDIWRANFGKSSVGSGSGTNVVASGESAAVSPKQTTPQTFENQVKESDSEGAVTVTTDPVSDAAPPSSDAVEDDVRSTSTIARSSLHTLGFERGPQSPTMRADQVSLHAHLKERSSAAVSSTYRDVLLAEWTSSRLSDDPSNIETVLETHFLDDPADYNASELDTAFANFKVAGTAVAVSVIH